MKTPTLDSQLCFALYSASSHVTSIYRPLLEALNITYPQFLVLMSLWEEDNISISTLAKRTCLGKPTMTPLLKRLEQKNLVSRNTGDVDERQKSVVLTAAGLKLSQQAGSITEQAFCATGLSRSEAKDVIRLCHKLVDTDLEPAAEK